MGRPPSWVTAATGRPAMRSPGRAPVANREHRLRFWEQIAGGATSEDAGVGAGVSPAVGTRWFREAGGMPPSGLKPHSGRYLTLAEREEIAICRAYGFGIREIARHLGRSASTISRELRRNAATRGGTLHYRAVVAQWKAERQTCRPKVSKLAANDRLREYGRTGCPVRCRSGRDPDLGTGGRLDRPTPRSASGPPVGDRMESGADCQPAPDRLPR